MKLTANSLKIVETTSDKNSFKKSENYSTPQLQVLPKPAVNRAIALGIACFFLLASSTFGVLILKIQVTQKQYQLANVISQTRSIDAETQVIVENIGKLSSPRNLSSKAAELGMIPANTHLFIDLDKRQITGELPAIPEAPTPNINSVEKENIDNSNQSNLDIDNSIPAPNF